MKEKIKRYLTPITIIILTLIACVGSIIVYSFSPNGRMSNDAKTVEKNNVIINDEKILEVFSELPKATDFAIKGTDINYGNLKFAANASNITVVNMVGEYTLSIKFKGQTYPVTLKVVDTVAPELNLKELSINEGETYDINSFIGEVKDNYDSSVTPKFVTTDLKEGSETEYIDYSSYKDPGEYTIKIEVEDSSKNKTVKETKLIIKKVEVAPVVSPSTNTNRTSGSNSSGNVATAPQAGVTQSNTCNELTPVKAYTGLLTQAYEWEMDAVKDSAYLAFYSKESKSNPNSYVGQGVYKWRDALGYNTADDAYIKMVYNSCGRAVAYYYEISINVRNAEPTNIISQQVSGSWMVASYYINSNGGITWLYNPNNLVG